MICSLLMEVIFKKALHFFKEGETLKQQNPQQVPVQPATGNVCVRAHKYTTCVLVQAGCLCRLLVAGIFCSPCPCWLVSSVNLSV